jgi:polyisoprenoid-binding protein YceI
MYNRLNVFTAAIFLIGIATTGTATVLPVDVFAQATYSVMPESVFTVYGRSNESDWDVTSTVISGDLALDDAADPMSVSTLVMSVPAAEIKAPRGLIMDRIMQGSLKSDEFPDITFEVTSVQPSDAPSDSLNLVVVGNFTLTGTTKEITVELFASKTGDGQPHYTGKFPLTMTDYGMEAPTAMFGKLRVHRDIEIEMDLMFALKD